MPVPSHSKRWNSQSRASSFISFPAGISSPPCIASPPTPLGGAAWRTHGNTCEAAARSIQAQFQQCHPVMGRLPCGAAGRAPVARDRALGEGKKREDLGSTSKTAAREAARQESLSPKEYKNHWGDEQGANCKNSNRGKQVEKRNPERMRVGG